ncbi:hypothetical protein SELMODRAFT_441602 [Selaginella moellendorffii]|uniref:Uncharacterized protein n=1 Tax=Selaginella moellendorffii TaxID=88036 RepID=D8RKZ1_SELML|nr:hypothetical protein SELMODRAFT_441602 [Selaginella moellendorffii]
MPQARVNTSFDGPNVDVLIDMGHPLLNRIVDGFIKVGGTGALHAAAQESMRYVSQESANKRSLEKSVNQMGKECLQWGMVAGIYSGMTYTMQEARGVHDWVLDFSSFFMTIFSKNNCSWLPESLFKSLGREILLTSLPDAIRDARADQFHLKPGYQMKNLAEEVLLPFADHSHECTASAHSHSHIWRWRWMESTSHPRCLLCGLSFLGKIFELDL